MVGPDLRSLSSVRLPETSCPHPRWKDRVHDGCMGFQPRDEEDAHRQVVPGLAAHPALHCVCRARSGERDLQVRRIWNTAATPLPTTWQGAHGDDSVTLAPIMSKGGHGMASGHRGADRVERRIIPIEPNPKLVLSPCIPVVGPSSLPPPSPQGPGQDIPSDTKKSDQEHLCWHCLPKDTQGSSQVHGLMPLTWGEEATSYLLSSPEVPGSRCRGKSRTPRNWKSGGGQYAYLAGQGSSLHFLWRSSGRLRCSQCSSSTSPACLSMQYKLCLCTPGSHGDSAWAWHQGIPKDVNTPSLSRPSQNRVILPLSG